MHPETSGTQHTARIFSSECLAVAVSQTSPLCLPIPWRCARPLGARFVMRTLNNSVRAHSAALTVYLMSIHLLNFEESLVKVTYVSTHLQRSTGSTLMKPYAFFELLYKCKNVDIVSKCSRCQRMQWRRIDLSAQSIVRVFALKVRRRALASL